MWYKLIHVYTISYMEYNFSGTQNSQYHVIRDTKHIVTYMWLSCKLVELFASIHCVTDWGGRGHEFQFRMPLRQSCLLYLPLRWDKSIGRPRPAERARSDRIWYAWKSIYHGGRIGIQRAGRTLKIRDQATGRSNRGINCQPGARSGWFQI